MQILDTLADGRTLCRLQSTLATQLLPGQKLLNGECVWPVFRHHPSAQTIDVVVAANASSLSSSLVVIGTPLAIDTEQHLRVITHNDGIFALLHFLFQQPERVRQRISVIAQFDSDLPFQPCPSRFFSAALPAGVIAALPLLDDWGIFNRIVHHSAVGCFDGNVAQLSACFEPAACEIVIAD